MTAVRNAVPREIPVSAKIRLGWSDPSEAAHIAESAVAGGADWLVIHARTRAQGYAPGADWKALAKLRERISIPIVANGDLWNIDDFRRCREESGCEHFMLARGALANPLLSLSVAKELGLSTATPTASSPSTAHWAALFTQLTQEVRATWNREDSAEVFLTARLKQWARFAASGKPPVPWFDAIRRLTSPAEIIATVAAFPPPEE